MLVTAFTLGISEFLLRTILNIEPGKRYYNRWFQPVDSVFLFNGMHTDTLGIFKVHPAAAETIRQRILRYHANNNLSVLETLPNEVVEVYSLANDFATMPETGNELAKHVEALQKKQPGNLTELEAEVLRYVSSPINDDGFKSIQMKPYKGARKKVLLLGDSFTWGHSTTNKTGSFADILIARGYAVYNTGISGADPAQYEAVARYYIPLLKPDIVIINFFMGNDIQWFVRQPQCGIPIHYNTNAGNLLSCPNGLYFTSADFAYNFAQRNMLIPTKSIIVKYTALGTLMWRVGKRFNMVRDVHPQDKQYWEKANALLHQKPVSNIHLKAIIELADSFGARPTVVAIPDFLSSNHQHPDQVEGLFEGVKWLLSPVKKEEYRMDDGHFNDDGHKTYANFLEAETGMKN